MAWVRQRALRLPRRACSGTRAPVLLLHALALWPACGRVECYARQFQTILVSDKKVVLHPGICSADSKML